MPWAWIVTSDVDTLTVCCPYCNHFHTHARDTLAAGLHCANGDVYSVGGPVPLKELEVAWARRIRDIIRKKKKPVAVAVAVAVADPL